jgi:hypothetical protein
MGFGEVAWIVGAGIVTVTILFGAVMIIGILYSLERVDRGATAGLRDLDSRVRDLDDRLRETAGQVAAIQARQRRLDEIWVTEPTTPALERRLEALERKLGE